MYYNANNELKASLIGYNLTHEEMQTAISNQSFDGFWDKIYYLDLEEIEIIEATPKSSKVSARRRRYHECDGIFNCDANGSNRWTRYGNNSGYGGYSGSGSSYSLPPLSNLPPQVAAALQAAGVFLGVNYNNRAPAGYGYNYTSPVRYFSVEDLTIPNTNSNSTPTPFNRRYFYYFPELKNKITTYYNQVYVSYINSYMTSTQTTLEDHNNKQRFITQFFKFLYKLRTENYSAFNYLANNPQKTVAVFNFLAENNSFNAYEFAKSAITALMNSGEVDFDDEIINELTGKALCAYNKLLSSGVSNFHNMITDLFIEFGDSNIGGRDLTFKMSSDLPNNFGGKTQVDSNGNYHILINENLMNTLSSIEVAAILVHEMAHAFLGKHYIDYNSSFTELYEKYINDTGIQNYSHDIMKDQFINRMATAIKNYDSSIFSNFEDYKILASQGVFELTNDQKEDLLTVKLLSRNNDKNCD